MANRLSIGAVWDETARFCRAEAGLLLPVAALGFGLPLVILLLAVPPDQAKRGWLEAGPWMAWLLPCGLLSMTGSLTISALALRPGASVAECLRIAIARLPAGLGLVALNLGFQFLVAIPAALLGQIETAMRGAPGVLALAGNVFALATTIWLFARAMPVWALLADRPIGPWAAARAVFALTQGRYRTMLLIRVAGGCAGVIALIATLVPIGALCLTLGMATGSTTLFSTLSDVLSAFAFVALGTIWTVFVARLYRRLASSSGI